MKDFKTAADIKIEGNEKVRIIKLISAEMKLRQWSVEQAVKIMVAQNADYLPTKDQIEAINQYFYDFVTKA